MAPALSDVRQFFAGQLFQTPTLPPPGPFKGQTVVITGGNSGLGFECAKQLGATTLILGCRSLSKAEAAKEAITALSPKADVRVWQIDMANYASVKAFAARLDELESVDALLLNAGISTKEYTLAEGIESTLVVNVISTFLLAKLALPILQRSAGKTGKPAHIVITGSAVHAFADHTELVSSPPGRVFQTLGEKKTAKMEGRYLLSKLLVQIATTQLARSVDPRQVIINAPSPGFCKTPLFDSDGGGGIGLRIIGRKAEVGARCLTAAAVAGKESHGQYLSEGKVKNMSVWLRSKEGKETADRVWKELLVVLDDISTEVQTNQSFGRDEMFQV